MTEKIMLKGVELGKKFGKNWIFRDLNFEVEVTEKTAITGKNGAGKSTLLQIMAGFLTPSKGYVSFSDKSPEEANLAISFIGPYTEVIEEFTLREFLIFHEKFRKALLSVDEMSDKASLPLDKQILEFSTGMKQRAKLITAFYFENDLLFMDEPTANLDIEGFNWWKQSLELLEDKTVIIASNDEKEIELCEQRIELVT